VIQEAKDGPSESKARGGKKEPIPTKPIEKNQVEKSYLRSKKSLPKL